MTELLYKKNPKDVFDFFKDKDDLMDINQLGDALRYLGYNISQDTLKVMSEKVDKDRIGKINFNQFLELLDRIKKLPPAVSKCEKCCESFCVACMEAICQGLLEAFCTIV